MRTYFECVPCFIRQALDSLAMLGASDATIEKTLRRVLAAAAQIDMRKSPPAMGRILHRIIRDETGSADPYREIKQRSTKRALDSSNRIRTRIDQSVDPFKAAVRFAIAGNIMDFALPSNWDGDKIDNALDIALEKNIDELALENLKILATKASSILLIGDNAGESVFDRLLIERFPLGITYYGVKGSPVINDVTEPDARQAGIDQVAKLIDNGNDAPGTILEDCSEKFKDIFYQSDLVIAKGQANYETLCDADREIFFLTQIKCPVIARDLKGEKGDWVVSSNHPSN